MNIYVIADDKKFENIEDAVAAFNDLDKVKVLSENKKAYRCYMHR